MFAVLITLILLFARVNVVYGETVTNISNLPNAPWGEVYDSMNGDIYVAVPAATSVLVINGNPNQATTNSIVDTIALSSPGTADYLAYDPSNGEIYVTGLDSEIYVINGAPNEATTNTVIDKFLVGICDSGVAYDSTNGDFYVADSCSNEVYVFDGSSNALDQTIAGINEPSGVAYDSTNGDIYVTDTPDGVVYVINGGSIISGITIPGGPGTFINEQIGFDPSNGEVYVPNDGNPGGNTVSVIDGTSYVTTVALPPVGGLSSSPAEIAYDAADGNMYVASSTGSTGCTFPCIGTNNVFVIDSSSNSVIGSPIALSCTYLSIPINCGSYWIVYDSSDQELYVSNSDDTSVSVISTTSSTGTAACAGTFPIDTCTGTPTQPGGTLTADSTSTGVSVAISGTSATGTVTITTSNDGTTPPPTGAVSLNGATYYDAEVSGATDGTALVCISPASGATTMEYYNGATWVSATGITTPDNSVCGNIPVSALTGTPLAIGNPTSTAPVPEFPFGLFALLAATIPVMFIMRARLTRYGRIV